MQAAFHQYRNIIYVLALPENIFALFIRIDPSAQAREHRRNILFSNTGKHLRPFKNGNIFFHKTSFLL